MQQDNAQHEQEQQVQQAETYYPVLMVGLGDFEYYEFHEDEWDDEATKEANKERLEFARRMSPYQWRRLGESMREILLDDDRWDVALSCAVDYLMYDQRAVPDNQAKQEAAR